MANPKFIPYVLGPLIGFVLFLVILLIIDVLYS
jgi:hypothetical protein